MCLLPTGIILFPFNPLPKYLQWYINNKQCPSIYLRLFVNRNFAIKVFKMGERERERKLVGEFTIIQGFRFPDWHR